ncbi:hypothetical protein N7509_005142 [Penicillium cosmopolitanum]|uniref:Methyltransferase domain-containing protein n=1 Tax=Penicillium cosmopolitanum TaxID=1131564 RepID=A0A9W9W1N4_9EURO|nr:uncharacterized protein N7509_005142 [Penicillium cosmopolitanum]KAJ5397029.1 hypothetical protein N7509_005142 [Penicillium cosmopolitanum]
MIAAIANEYLPAIKYGQLSWDSIATAWPTGLLTDGYYSHHLQLPPQEILPVAQGWPDQALDTVCGWGSSKQHTRRVRKDFAQILKTYQVVTLNDAGCGDLAWISMVDLWGIDYVGYDIYERANWAEMRQRGYQLDILDITANESRPADLLICRDVFIHLPNDMILPALERFRRSASLLLTTSYTGDSSSSQEFSNFQRMNEPSLRHAKLDLTLPPFNLGHPLVRIPRTRLTNISDSGT